MNTIEIYAPRWHDRKILVAEWKLGMMNKIVVKDKRLPEPLYITGRDAMKYPTEVKRTRAGAPFTVRVIPIDAFKTEPAVVRA